MGPQQGGAFVSRNGQMTSINGLEMQNNVPSEVITSPTTVNEAYIGSLKAMLIRNKGNYIVATFFDRCSKYRLLGRHSVRRGQ